ncbi:sialate O-acetylesterase [Prevotella sp. AGR2160]|uniref:sialate O-acetylesterase n=1 Tax=Prevotella sp. AGR2160 TaxID=1280674 RepID=UPI0004228F01|nr:sialate O-acetylesterase [Prevotella sp. AGR2160]
MQKITLLLAALTLGTAAQAKIVLPDLVSDNMVLQQQTDARLWGKATPKATIEVSDSWSGGKAQVTVAKDSTWLLTVKTPKGTFDPQTLTVTEKDAEGTVTDTKTLSNVLIGEVWYAGGQSNMEMPLNGFWNCPIKDSNEEIATSGEWAGKIRMATVPKTGNTQPQEWVSGCQWKVPSPATAGNMSATAWYFAQMMERVLQVPVGILTVAWGGSSVEGWTPREILNTYKEIDLKKELKRGWNGRWWEWYTPLIMYNGMLHPVRHYTIRGFIWYQGEANVGKPDYVSRMKTMINVFRKEFGSTAAELPFYLTEIAPWAGYGDSDSAPLLRDGQHQVGREVENSGCICTNDLVEPYEYNQIHPHEKRQVGYRLAYMALNKTYGFKDIKTDYPEYDHSVVRHDSIQVFFKNSEDGLTPLNDIKGFEIAGADGKFYPATATVDQNTRTVFVTAKAVKAPVQVRYGYKAFLPGNLKGSRNLPVIPFAAKSH